MNLKETMAVLRRAELANLLPKETDPGRATERADLWQRVLAKTTFEDAQKRLEGLAGNDKREWTLHPGVIRSQPQVNATGIVSELQMERDHHRESMKDPAYVEELATMKGRALGYRLGVE